MHVRRDDMVEVTKGNDAGKKGKVLRAFPQTGKIVVEGVNLRWKTLRKSQQNPKGGRVHREMPIFACNVKKAGG